MPQIKEYTQRVGGAAELPLAQVTRQAYASDFNGAGVGAQIAGNALSKPRRTPGRSNAWWRIRRRGKKSRTRR
jgi:hypothetical protein